MYRKNKNLLPSITWRLALPATVGLLTVVTFLVLSPQSVVALLRGPASDGANPGSLFSESYPVPKDFQLELKQLLDNGDVTPLNEQRIREWTTATALDMEMPPAVLWCLFFQESRLHHMVGSNDARAAKGLGQFLSSTFLEVNQHLDRYTPVNSATILRRMGRDIRPVRAEKFKNEDVTSYYFIPTAVLTSGSYLNNRYHQLAKNLRSKGITPNPDLLWLYSVMAYNKGTRSVLSFWNDAHRRGGIEKVRLLVTDLAAFNTAFRHQPSLRRALNRIWNPNQAERYARELKVHLQNASRCSLRPELSAALASPESKNGGKL
jgi:hypothetical protein